VSVSIQKDDRMSFLNWPVEQNQFSQRARQRRKSIVLGLLDQFGEAFPEITYELFWESPTVNAQAWRFGSAGRVRVYGGLVRHPKITRAGLALMLAHETGHHLGGPPYDPDMPWISWQGQADYWAASEGMKKVFGLHAQTMIMRGAFQIRELHRDFASALEEDQPDLSSDCRHSIFVAGATGREMPDCAKKAFTQLCSD
jgi:Peptidase family M48